MTGLDREAARLDPHVLHGPGTVARLPEVVESLGARRVLLVCGRRSLEASGAAAVLPALQRRATVVRWDDFAPNTDADDLARGLRVLADAAPDLVLGIGGGSAMDMAKLLCAYRDVDPGRLPDAVRAGGRIEDRAPGLVLVPTTSGSGSEATHFAVVYLGHAKHSVAGPAMLPDRVVMDPELPVSGAAHQRATSGVDALSQAIESLWATGATAASREDARRGMSLLLTHIVTFVRAPIPESARGMSLGSHLAGRAINVSRTTAAHALSYGITKRHGVPHGHAVALTLGAFLEVHATAGPADLREGVAPEEHAAAVREILDALGASDGAGAHSRWDSLLADLGLEPRLSAVCGDDPGERTALASTVNAERLANDPVRLDDAALRSVLATSG